MTTINGTRCCAKCGTPFGHSALAGRCCHGRSWSEVVADGLLDAEYAAETTATGQGEER